MLGTSAGIAAEAATAIDVDNSACDKTLNIQPILVKTRGNISAGTLRANEEPTPFTFLLQLALDAFATAHHIAFMRNEPRPRWTAGDRWPVFGSTEMTVTAFVLIAIVAVAAGLGYQAQAANGANVATARHALTQYSSVAAWQFARTAQREMQMAADVTIGVRLQRARQAAGHASSELLAPAALRSAAPASDCDCQPALRVEQFFRWDVGSDDVLSEAPWPEKDRRALAGRLAADVRDPNGDRHMAPEQTVLAGAIPTDQQPARWSHANCDLLVDVGLDGKPRLLAIVATYDDARRLRALYGAIVPIAEAATVFNRVLKRESLLPTALLQRASQDSVIAVRVAAGTQDIFARGPVQTADFVAVDSLGSATFRATVLAGLQPAVADRLIIGGLPRSRLPLIGLFLALALALLGVALRQMRRTLELTRLRSDFVSSASHELRTPLSLIRVYTETLIDDATVGAEERGRFHHVILKESNRLGRLIDNLLRFADLERHATALTLSPTNLCALLDATVTDFRPLADANAMVVEGQFADGLTALVDAGALRQMMFNLLTNAVKFGGRGTRIAVTLARSADRAQITVDDQGPGIPVAQRRRVFDRYVRLANVGDGGAAGSGIGLAIVRELAHAQRMSVWIDGSPLGGTRVVLSVPLVDASAEIEESAPVAATTGGRV